MASSAVFITGATGLVGSHLARLLLLRGYSRIIALKRPKSDLILLGNDAGRITWIDGDILDVEALAAGMQDADLVIHCAGLISYDPKDRNRLHAVNVEGTANVVNAALAAGVERLVYISSVSVLSRTGKSQVVTEGTPWQPTRYTSIYGLTKHLAEREVQRGVAEGLKASILIPSIILGAGKWDNGSATIFHQIGRGMPAYPLGQNGFVDVRDVALLATLLLEQEESYRVIASGHTVSYRVLFSEIATRIGKMPPGLPVGPLMSELLWRLFLPVRWITGRMPVINRETTRAAQSYPEYDHNASLQVPGFQYTPLAQTLDDIAERYLIARQKKFQPEILDFGDRFSF